MKAHRKPTPVTVHFEEFEVAELADLLEWALQRQNRACYTAYQGETAQKFIDTVSGLYDEESFRS